MVLFSMGTPPTLRLKDIVLQYLLFLSLRAGFPCAHDFQKQSLPC